MGISADIEQVYKAQMALLKSVTEASSLRLQHECRDNFVRKLDTLVKTEEDALDNIRKNLVNVPRRRCVKRTSLAKEA